MLLFFILPLLAAPVLSSWAELRGSIKPLNHEFPTNFAKFGLSSIQSRSIGKTGFSFGQLPLGGLTDKAREKFNHKPIFDVPRFGGMVDKVKHTLNNNVPSLADLSQKVKNELPSFPEKLPSVTDFSDKLKKIFEVQSHTNKVVDIALAQITRALKLSNSQKIRIPELNEEFSFGYGWLQTSGTFNATDGYFSDLTTLNRTNDVVPKREGLKLSLSCGLGFSKAEIEYNDYKLKYGLINVNGNMSADIDGVDIDFKFVFDYSLRPCKAKLETLKITKFGHLEVYVNGLGPLNLLVSSVATEITEYWEKNIVEVVETKIRDVIEQQIEKFICDKFFSF